jgi:hypothetical protein
MKCAKHLARFRRSFATFIVTEAATNLTANLTAGEIRRVHVRTAVRYDLTGGEQRKVSLCAETPSGD